MPLIPIIAGVVGLGTGFFVGNGTEGIGTTVKYAVIGAGLYLGAKHFKVI